MHNLAASREPKMVVMVIGDGGGGSGGNICVRLKVHSVVNLMA
jgi:hypothetical protein